MLALCERSYNILTGSSLIVLTWYIVAVSDFECAGDEVLVESSPPASPDMAARLAAPAQVHSFYIYFV